MFRLSDLLKYDDIVIQCHNNPDADAVSSAFGVYAYLLAHGKSSRIVYSGFEKIRRQNMLILIDSFGIPIRHINDEPDIKKPGLLVCVDCQYGEGNVAKIEAEKIAIIDHHLQVIDDGKLDLGVIKSNLGSCATLVWKLLKSEEFDFEANRNVASALYYGLFTDTNKLMEIDNPDDKDARDHLEGYCDMDVISKMRTCNITIDELEIAGVALLRNYTNAEWRYAILKAEPCDQSILAIAGEMAIEVDGVDLSVVYSQREDGVKLSVRSCANDVMASQFIEYITRDVGSGGGHAKKSGGWIKKTALDELGISADEYIKTMSVKYFEHHDIIREDDHGLDISKMRRYRKTPTPRGFVQTTDIFEAGTRILVRMIEGDSHVTSSPDQYLMIGLYGETYPIEAEKFHKSYRQCDESFSIPEGEYKPNATNIDTGERKSLIPFMKTCVADRDDTVIYARQLERPTKLFSHWTPNGYMHCDAGDYIAVRCDDINDVYLVRKDIFERTYEECVG